MTPAGALLSRWLCRLLLGGFIGTVALRAQTTYTSGQTASGIVNVGDFASLYFIEDSSAGNATIGVSQIGFLNFTDTSTAANSQIYVQGGARFSGNSTAANALINSLLTLDFWDSATAGSANITLVHNAAQIIFHDGATAGNATIDVGPGTMRLYDSTSGGQASVNVALGGKLMLDARLSDVTLARLTGSGSVFLSPSSLAFAPALILGGTNANSVFQGGISGYGSLVKVGTGALTLSGNSGALSYFGDTTVSAGRLTLNGSLTHSAVTVQSGGTLGGTGTFGNLVTVNSGAHLAPGNSPGTLTFADGLALDGGAVLDFELGSTSDLIRVSGGDLIGPSSGTVTINLTNTGSFAANTYVLFDFAGATPSDFAASDFTLGTTIAGYDYAFVLGASTLSLVATTAVPEPSAYAALLGLGALALVIGRRRSA